VKLLLTRGHRGPVASSAQSGRRPLVASPEALIVSPGVPVMRKRDEFKEDIAAAPSGP
jgi:hypothetical protein